MKLTPAPSAKITAPLIAESPINIECVVKEIIEQGSHHLFMAEVVNIQADEAFIDLKTGAFDIAQTELIAYANGFYFQMGDIIGKFGFSVMKKKKKNRSIPNRTSVKTKK
jgi:flavin reductase (DIM6/NTAB) family NADH-FMN oxidoreductase RutF